MKNQLYILSIFIFGLLFGCSSLSPDEKDKVSGIYITDATGLTHGVWKNPPDHQADQHLDFYEPYPNPTRGGLSLPIEITARVLPDSTIQTTRRQIRVRVKNIHTGQEEPEQTYDLRIDKAGGQNFARYYFSVSLSSLPDGFYRVFVDNLYYDIALQKDLYWKSSEVDQLVQTLNEIEAEL